MVFEQHPVSIILKFIIFNGLFLLSVENLIDGIQFFH